MQNGSVETLEGEALEILASLDVYATTLHYVYRSAYNAINKSKFQLVAYIYSICHTLQNIVVKRKEKFDLGFLNKKFKRKPRTSVKLGILFRCSCRA